MSGDHAMSRDQDESSTEYDDAAADEAVVVVHGWGAHRWLTALLAKRLTARFGRVVNWGYRSLRKTIASHAEQLKNVLDELDTDATYCRVHLVSHSMGGIVGRQALLLGVPRKMGRFVMIAPPNQGSPVASFFGPLFKPVCRTLDELASRPDSYVNQLPRLDGVPTGIIAARSDIQVPLANTKLDTARQRIVLPGRHSSLLFRRDLAEHVTHFLEHGEFADGHDGGEPGKNDPEGDEDCGKNQ